jgi:hypothetical protein
VSVSANADKVGKKIALRRTPTALAKSDAWGPGRGLTDSPRVMLLILLLLIPVTFARLRTVCR